MALVGHSLLLLRPIAPKKGSKIEPGDVKVRKDLSNVKRRTVTRYAPCAMRELRK